MTNANIKGFQSLGILGGTNYGEIVACYTTGYIQGLEFVGGIVGGSHGTISTSYSTADVSRRINSRSVGGLVGHLWGTVTNSYATGRVTGQRSYGGLIGSVWGSLTASYWDISTSGQASSTGGVRQGQTSRQVGQTSRQLQSVTSYTGIYENWNIDLDNADGDGNTATGKDDPWTFGTQDQYPVLKYAGMDTTAQFDAQPVTGVTVAPKGDTLSVTWDAKTNATGYLVQWKSGMLAYPTTDIASATHGQATISDESTTTYDISGLTEGTAYAVRVVITFSGGRTGTPSAEVIGSPGIIIDYDLDGDGYIDVANLAQLNAIRYDPTGNGVATHLNYASAFPNRITTATASVGRMGCPPTGCVGYELTASLDFDSDGDGDVDANDSSGAYWNNGAGWNPIGDLTNPYAGNFKGNGYTINNLFINIERWYYGLFGYIASSSRIEALGVTNANIKGWQFYGILVGINDGEIVACYTTGQIQGRGSLGGIAGESYGTISNSYSTADVTGTNNNVGGLVGKMGGGTVTNSYATGRVTGESNFGGLIGYAEGSPSITASYWDISTSGQTSSAGGVGQTTADLQNPTTYTGIYENWNVDLDGDNVLDYPWNFGTSSQYPTLNMPRQREVLRLQVSISSESVPEGAAGTNTRLRFTVQLNRASTSQVTVVYTDAGTGSAESGTDYTALAGGTLTFAAGETSKTITISVIGDAAAEPDETVVVTLSNAVNAALGTASATGTITDNDDTDPTFSEALEPQSYPQGNEIDLTLPEAIGGNGTLTYALTPDLPEGLSFDAETLTVSGTPLEASEKAIYTLTVTDEDGDAAEVSFFLTVSANLIPSFGDASVDAQSLMRKQEIESLTLPQATGGDDPLTYALTPDLPTGLKFNAETRVLSGTPLDAMDETTYTLTATDSDGDPATLMFTLSVMTDPIPIFGDTTIVAQGYQHQAFAPLTLPQATGGDEPLTYALNPDPPLPEGLKFDAETLTVSGTPLKAMAEMTYTLTATDDNGDEVHLMFTLEIPDLMPTFGSDTTIAAQSYLVNQEIESLTFPQASSGDGMLVYILLPSLPDGISFNPDTRTLSGMPTAEKTLATYTLSALDTDGDVASLPFTLEVSLPSPDFNGDGVVNFADFLTFADKFGSRLGQERYDARCDLNGDGEIGFDDFLIFATDFGG